MTWLELVYSNFWFFEERNEKTLIMKKTAVSTQSSGTETSYMKTLEL